MDAEMHRSGDKQGAPTGEIDASCAADGISAIS
jgi:hypothetical protein